MKPLNTFLLLLCFLLSACMPEGKYIEKSDLAVDQINRFLERPLPENAMQVRSRYQETHGQGVDIRVRVRFALPAPDLDAFVATLQSLTTEPLELVFSGGPNNPDHPEWHAQTGHTYKQITFYSLKGQRRHYLVHFDLTESETTTIYIQMSY